MATLTLNFASTLNTSVSVGDTAYYIDNSNISTPSGTTLESADTSNIVEIGSITSLNGSLQSDGTTTGSHIVCDTALGDVVTGHATNGDFILFSKDNAASMSSILGYYAEVKMKNTNVGTDDAEIFQIGLGIFESSK